MNAREWHEAMEANMPLDEERAARTHDVLITGQTLMAMWASLMNEPLTESGLWGALAVKVNAHVAPMVKAANERANVAERAAAEGKP